MFHAYNSCGLAVTIPNPYSEILQEEKAMVQNNKQQVSWGPKLFVSVLILALVFFWWLLLYSHGITVHE